MKILKISLFVSLLFFSNLAFGLDAPQNIILDKASDNTLDLSWDKVEGAGVYAISYGTQTASGGTYEHDLEVVVNEEAKGKIENLDPNTKYFIGVRSYDADNNESEYSKEVSFSTLEKMVGLEIDGVEIIDTRNIKINFNLNLNKDSNVNLNLVNINNDLESIEVEKYEIKNNELEVFLNKDLKLENKYSVTILTLEGLNGETIKAGVDGIKDFFVDKETKEYKEELVDTELNAAGTGVVETEKEEVSQTKVLGGKDLVKKEELTAKVAKDKKDLPTTGPAETFLFLLFSLIAGALFINLRRKTNA